MKTTLHSSPIKVRPASRIVQTIHVLTLIFTAAVLMLTAGCGSSGKKKENTGFFTSGSREADQRASQRMAKDEQLKGTGEGSGEEGSREAKVASSADNDGGGTNKAAKVEGKLSLFERLGSEAGVSNIVADFTARVLQDPRVDWQRKGVKRGGMLHRDKGPAWIAAPENVAILNKHLVQFLALATGGPAHYEGKEIQGTHSDMKISNPEFDAAVGDMKASLDRLQVPNKEQKELLAIIESTRPQIVTLR